MNFCEPTNERSAKWAVPYIEFSFEISIFFWAYARQGHSNELLFKKSRLYKLQGVSIRLKTLVEKMSSFYEFEKIKIVENFEKKRVFSGVIL